MARLIHRCWFTVSLLAVLTFFAFDKTEDRMLQVSCDRSNFFAAVTTPQAALLVGAGGAFVSSRQYVPGSIVKLAPESPRRMTGASVIYSPPRSGSYSSVSIDWLSVRLVDGALSVNADERISAVAKEARSDLRGRIVRLTEISFSNLKAEHLQDALGFINSDARALNSVRSEGNETLLLISETLSPASAGIHLVGAFDERDAIAQHMLVVGAMYLHVTYSCSQVSATDARLDMADGSVPTLYYYLPVIYDFSAGKVIRRPGS